MSKKRIGAMVGSLLLATMVLLIGMMFLNHGAATASPDAALPPLSFSVMKKPGVSTRFWLTNTGSIPTIVLHSYFAYGDPTPVFTTTHPLAVGAGHLYDVAAEPGLPPIFYGKLTLASPETLLVKVVAPIKRVTGKVTYLNSTTPVTNAHVIAHRVGTPDRVADVTDMTSGMYTLILDGGRWQIEILPMHGQTGWIFTDPPAEVEFTQPITMPEVQRVDFSVVPAQGHLLGMVYPITVPTRIIARNSQGIGNETLTFPNGHFDLQVPVGMYNLYIRPLDTHYGGLDLHGVLITETTYIPPAVYLRPTNAVITGRVTDAAGKTLIGVMRPARVIAWERQGPGWAAVETAPDGSYRLPIVAGNWPTEWVVRVEPPPTGMGAPPYVPDKPKEVSLRRGMSREVNFHLLPADGKIIGQAVLPNGVPLDILGRTHALRHPQDTWPQHFNAPMYNGTFTLTVPTTHTYDMLYDVAVHPDPSLPLAAGYRRDVNPPTSGDIFITVPLRLKDAVIQGALVDARLLPTVTRIITGVHAQVFAVNRPPDAPGGALQSRWINPQTGMYRLGVFSDTWRIDFRTQPPHPSNINPQPVIWLPHPRFRQDPQWHLQTVESGEIITVPLPVIPLTQAITGSVRMDIPGPHQRPLPYVKVCAEGIDDINKGIRGCVETSMFGHYDLPTTPGHYRVHVQLPHDFIAQGFLPPDVEIANAPEGEVNFVVRQANAAVQGRVLISTTAVLTQPQVLVWGWSMNGSHIRTEVPLPDLLTTPPTFGVSTTYALSVTGTPSGTVWYVGAAYQSGGVIYRAPRRRVLVTAGGMISLNLRLESVADLLGHLPEPRSVTFDRSLGMTIALDNGATLQIPAGAIPADTDEVILDIYPLGLVPEQRFEEVVGYGYAIAAYDADGNQVLERFMENIALTLPYDPAMLPPGVDESDILPAYLSTTSGRWEAPESYVVDTVNDEVTLYIDHFTDFALTAPPSVETPSYTIYLPLILR